MRKTMFKNHFGGRDPSRSSVNVFLVILNLEHLISDMVFVFLMCFIVVFKKRHSLTEVYFLGFSW